MELINLVDKYLIYANYANLHAAIFLVRSIDITLQSWAKKAHLYLNDIFMHSDKKHKSIVESNCHLFALF